MIRHAHVSAVPDDPTKDVSSAKWNDAHVIEDGSVEVEHLSADVQEILSTAVVEGDARLTDARTPLAHSHVIDDIDALQDALDAFTSALAAKVPLAQTADRVLVSDDAGSVTTDSVLVWDNSNKRLGVGAAPSYSFDVVKNALGAAPVNNTDASQIHAALRNTTEATSGAQTQHAPALIYEGHAWQSGSGGSDKLVRIQLQGRVVPATSGPSMFLALSSFNGTNFADEIFMGAALAGDAPSLRIRDGNIVFRSAGRGISFVSAPLTDALDSSFIISGDVSGGKKRIKFTTTSGYVFVEGNNFGGGAGVVPSMDFRNFDDSTSTPIIGIRHRATPGGTVANGFGVRQLYQANSSTTADQNQGAFDVVWNDVTHASRSADFVVSLVHNAAALAEKFRMRSNGQFDAATLAITDGVTAPSATSGQAKIFVDTADGDLKIIFGDGTVKTIVTD